jgi:hypothetical protein
MSLHELQRRFATSVAGEYESADFDTRGMRVYANNYRGQLIATLRDTYAKTRLWLGDDDFDRAAGRYIDANMPSSWTLDAYGLGFPDMLETDYPGDPDVGELAWLDGTLRWAFSVRDAVAIGPDALLADDWERVAFVFVPSLRFRRLRSNAVSIWKALADEIMPPAATCPDDGGGVRVWRRELSPQFASMDADECACLDLALTGATFGELCELLSGQYPSVRVPAEAGRLLRSWVSGGLIESLRQE